MDNSIAVFNTADLFTLIVGPERQSLTVTRHVLEKIPFFQKALSGAHFKEAKENRFELLEDDPQTVADVLFFSLSDHVAPIDDGDEPVDAEFHAKARKHLQAWILADKFMAERTANKILDELIRCYYGNAVHPKQIGILGAAGLQETKIYQLYVDQVAAQLKIDRKSGNLPLYGSWTTRDGEDMFEGLSHADMKAIIQSLTTNNGKTIQCPIDQFNVIEDEAELCTMHTHHLTERCGNKS